jgi:hypothetical protein
LEAVPDSGANCERVDVGEGSCKFLRETDEIIFADWGDLDGVGEFEIRSVGMSVRGEKLL